MSASQRRKGQVGEREVAAILTDQLGWVVNRTLNQTRDGGHDIETGCFRWEVKRRAKIAVHEFMQQAVASCADEGTPVVVMRGDGKDWLVMMRLEDILPLIRDQLAQR
jgi:hypothetical protein